MSSFAAGRIRYTDTQRRRLATAAQKLGRKALKKLDTLVTPDTLLRWYRRLVAAKYDSNAGRRDQSLGNKLIEPMNNNAANSALCAVSVSAAY